jgi:hypothetical protein
MAGSHSSDVGARISNLFSQNAPPARAGSAESSVMRIRRPRVGAL